MKSLNPVSAAIITAVVMLTCLHAASSNASSHKVMRMGELLQKCEAKTSNDELTCLMWLHGFEAGFHTGRANANISSAGYCLPKSEVTYEQLRLMFLKAGRGHPEKMHLYAGPFIFAMLRHEFPCN